MTSALGLIETKGLTGAIEACNAAANAGEVVIASAEPMESGHVTVKIEGEWSAVQSAVNAGARAAQQAGELVSIHLIPRSDDGVSPLLPYRRFLERYHPEPSVAETAEHVTPITQPMPLPSPATKPKPRPKPKAKTARVRTSRSVVNNGPRSDEPEAETALAAPQPARPESPAVHRADLEAMPVVKLRQFARTVKELPIQGRQISMANKTDLLSAIAAVLEID